MSKPRLPKFKRNNQYEASVVNVRRHCYECNRITPHTSILQGYEETLTCRKCGFQQKFNTR